jgi:hypothetical protein
LNSYAKAAQSASKYLGDGHPMTQNMNEVLSQATKKIANIIQKTMAKSSKHGGKQQAGAMAIGDLEALIRSSDLD